MVFTSVNEHACPFHDLCIRGRDSCGHHLQCRVKVVAIVLLLLTLLEWLTVTVDHGFAVGGGGGWG